MNIECSKCEGRGVYTEDCYYARFTGKCSKCNGTGEIQDSSHNGSYQNVGEK